ncbi:MAG: flagellar biosynthesis protein FlgL [Rhodobacteraceae bacterium]|nr:flagellar biosynthesis protein FlgL [Paracoccaceae bacterium]
MSFISIGDLSRGFALRSQNAEIKARLTRLSSELASGQTADPAARVRGDFRPLAAIARSLAVMDAYDLAGAEAALTTDAMQTALGQLTDAAQTLGSSLVQAASMPDGRMLSAVGNETRERLEGAVSALNTRVAGRALFAGAETDGAALLDGATILSTVTTQVAGLGTASDIMDVLDTWFDTPGGGFDALAYQGSDLPAGPVRLAEGQSLTLDVKASDPAVRGMLKALVAGALLADPGTLNGDTAARAALARRAGEGLLTAEAPLTALRADIGTTQAHIETIQAQNAAHRGLLELAQADILAVDPYETATEIEAVQTQLETLYTVTARLSRLSLANYLT